MRLRPGRRRSAGAGRSGRRRARRRCRPASSGPSAWRAPHADEPEVAVHRPLLLVDARLRSSARARCSARRSRPGSYDHRSAAPAPARRERAPAARSSRAAGSALTAGASATSAVAPSARAARRPPAYLPPAARGKKITRSASRGIVVERADHAAPRAGPAAPASAPRPTVPASSWRRNSSISRCSSSAQLDVALGDQHLTVARLHPQKTHAADYVKTVSAPDRS